jgi:hypothetical protein
MYVSNILLLTVCCDFINCVFQTLSLCFCNVYQLQVLYCSHYLHFLGSDPVTIAIWGGFKNYHKNKQYHLLQCHAVWLKFADVWEVRDTASTFRIKT